MRWTITAKFCPWVVRTKDISNYFAEQAIYDHIGRTPQNQFAAIVKKVESIKSRYQQSLAELESLYGALSQKAFKGQLDLSRVPLPADDAEIIRT